MALIQNQFGRAKAMAEMATGPVDTMPLRRCSFPAMGTTCLVMHASPDEATSLEFEQSLMAWVARFESRYSRFRPDSELSRINAAAGGDWVSIDDEMNHMLEMCQMVHFMTRSIVDVTAGPLARLWNYHTTNPRLPSVDEVAAAKKLVGWHKVQREPGRVRLSQAGMSLDFGGWAKEFAVDLVVEMATERGIENVLVDFGHDIRVKGRPPGKPAWHVGLEQPGASDEGKLHGSIALSEGAVASSGDYQRGFTIDGTRYGHIIDPRTGRPAANGVRQVTVIAPTCLQAGLLSTAAFVLGPREGIAFIDDTMGAESCMVSDHARHQTRGFFQYVVS